MLQCIASFGAGFIQIGMGAELICSTVIIGGLAEDEKNNDKKSLTMTIDEQSWLS